MLRLRRLELEDFGPYKGVQEFRFPDGEGVTVVYGENRRGKTSLLNAIRFALLGQVVTRGSRPLQFHKVLNTAARAEGRTCFRVALDFTFEGHTYALTRRAELRPGATEPLAHNDFKQTVFLQRDGQAVSQTEAEHELARIMPPQIARFFLFDGELLSEYEELLRDRGESDVGPKIAAAIEQILGLPVLQNARADLSALADEAAQEESRAAQRDKNAQSIGALLENLTAMHRRQREEGQRLERELEQATARKAELEETLKKSTLLASLLADRDRLEREITDLEVRQEDKKSKLQTAMQAAWRGIIARRITPLYAALRARRDDLQGCVARHLAAVERARELRVAVQAGKCPTCAQPVDPSAASRLAAEADTAAAGDVAAEQRELLEVQQELDAAARLSGADDTARVADLFDDVEQIKVELHTRGARLREVVDEVTEYNESEYRLQRKQYDETAGDIRILQRGLAETAAEVQKLEEQLRDARKKLDRVSGASLAGERQKRETFGALASLFRDAIEVYRERLRARVERDASDLFLKLTSEPEDAGLRINGQYGLTIVHRDGTDIVVRSSGAEQIVALSLMGALQKNAPLRGPLIADSLLMRVDDAHRENLVRALPSMAEQVAVLVFRAEMRPEESRRLLGERLLTEYQIERVSAKHSTLVPYEGGR